jgi:hypothetical protein
VEATVIGATARAAARRGSQDDHHGRASLDRGTAEQRHRVRSAARQARSAPLAWAGRRRGHAGHHRDRADATGPVHVQHGVVGRVAHIPAAEPRSRAGRVADHHAHPYRRRPWPPPSARPDRRAAGRCRGSTAAGRAASRAGRRPSRLRPRCRCRRPAGDEQAAVGGQPYACAASPYIIYTTAGMEILSGVAVSIPLWACSLGSPEIPRTRMRAMSETGPIEPPLPSSTI